MAQVGCGLHDGIETPARGAVDEEADEDALVEKAGSGLHARSGEEEKRKKVVVNAEVERWNDDADEKERDEEPIDGEVASEAAFEAEVVYLTCKDGQKKENDDGECNLGTGLDFEIVSR